jgi:hypothetical protein
MFDSHLDQLQKIKMDVVNIVTASADATAKGIARQCFDHLDAGALFLGQLGAFIMHRADQVEAEVEQAAKNGTVKGMTFPTNGAQNDKA